MNSEMPIRETESKTSDGNHILQRIFVVECP
jgi:hypothetical protein